MVADVPLDDSQVDERGVLYTRAVSSVFGGYHVNVNVRAVGCLKVREAKNAAAILDAIDCCGSLGWVRTPVKSTGLEDLCR